MRPRFPEIDLVRGGAVLLMMVYHAAFDLRFLYDWDIPVLRGGWWLLARTTATLFLLVAGASFALSWARRAEDLAAWNRRFLRRTVLLLLATLAVTAATWLFDTQTYVRFGILHLILVGSLLLPLFAPLKESAAIPGVALIAFQSLLRELLPSSLLFLPFGAPPAGFRSIDYFPLIPWLGVMLLGFALGHALYAHSTAWRLRLSSSLKTKNCELKTLTWPGRHSLFLYLVHQPVIVGILWLLFGKP